MTDAEALMWQLERDPVLRSSFVSVTFLDRPPDMARLRRRMRGAVAQIPRLRQRVVESPGVLGTPTWVDDPSFDLDYHVRHIALPAPAAERELLDLAALLYEDTFDPTRPLWQFTVVEGLEGGRAALIVKMHHTISDGVGAVRLSAMFIDIEPDPPEPDDEPAIPEPVVADQSLLEMANDAFRRPFDLGRMTLSGVAGAVTNPVDVSETVWAAFRQLFVSDAAHSPLWAGRRSAGRHFEILSADLERGKAAAKRLGGTVNDLYVAAIAGAAGSYHRAKGTTVDELRASVPISTRSDRSAGGNSFLPSRLLVPTGAHPAERFRAVHERMVAVKQDRSLGVGDAVAAILTRLPPGIVVRLARSQVDTVDFAASNVKGAPFELYVGGAAVLANHPFGPTGGTALNVTMLSYKGSMDIGVTTDSAAVDDPALLRACLSESFAELIAAGG